MRSIILIQPRLGMYRPFGLIGSPHMLGILHVIGVIYMFHYKQYKWSILGLLAVFISTSITAYGVMKSLINLGIDPKKIFIGGAFYIKTFKNVENINNGLNQL